MKPDETTIAMHRENSVAGPALHPADHGYGGASQADESAGDRAQDECAAENTPSDFGVVEERTVTYVSADGTRGRTCIVAPPAPKALLYWLPGMGIGVRSNLAFARALAQRGFAVAVHEWRGLGESDLRASRRRNWGYHELLDLDMPAGLRATRATFARLPLWIGGHSLGGQLAIIELALKRFAFEGALLVASGQPTWRSFAGRSRWVWAFAKVLPAFCRIVGFFPGKLLGFGGRQPRTLMTEWASTIARGDYHLPAFEGYLNSALADLRARAVAIQFTDDWLSPLQALERLRQMTPEADWEVHRLSKAELRDAPADHFGWMAFPEPAAALLAGAMNAQENSTI
jgi:predicted alpha/beta hydrolase